MDLLSTPEQDQIVESVRALLAGAAPLRPIQDQAAPSNWAETALWRRMAELGWFGLGMAGAEGGVGYTIAEELLMFREIGRQVAPGPILATALAARLASLAGERSVASALLDGTLTAGLGEICGPGAGGPPLNGELVLWDSSPGGFVLVADDRAAALYEVDGLKGFQVVECMDRSVGLALASATDLTPVVTLSAGVDPIAQRAIVLAAATLAGNAEATTEMSADYAKVREQFGRPIGAFQAVQHRCADMVLRAESAWSLAVLAGLGLDESGIELPDYSVSAAKALAGTAALENARANIQNHGGMGFTAEYAAHLYLRRAHVVDQMLRPGRVHLDRVMAAQTVGCA